MHGFMSINGVVCTMLRSNLGRRCTFFGLFLLGLTGVGYCASAVAQVSLLNCQGHFMGAQATLSGTRQFKTISAMGDGHVRFQGRIGAGGMVGEIAYEGYTHTSLPGFIRGPLGEIAVGVLDNTDGRMIIYEGGAPSMWAPKTLGEFICDWR